MSSFIFHALQSTTAGPAGEHFSSRIFRTGKYLPVFSGNQGFCNIPASGHSPHVPPGLLFLYFLTLERFFFIFPYIRDRTPPATCSSLTSILSERLCEKNKNVCIE